MTEPGAVGPAAIGTGVALLELFLLSAAICAPLAGWLATRRRRSVPVWAVFGALIGPLALVLLLAAPPGTCPACGTPGRGWERQCQACGAMLDGSLAPAPAAATAGPPALSTPAFARPARIAPPAASARPVFETPEGQPRPFPAAGGVPGPVARLRAVTSAEPPRPRPELVRAEHDPGPPPEIPARRTSRERRRLATPPSRASETVVVATGVFVSGTQALEVGARYALGILDDDLALIGPLDTSPDAIAFQRPRGPIRATVVEHNLVLTAGPHTRPDLALGFQSVSTWGGADLEQLFPGDDPSGAA